MTPNAGDPRDETDVAVSRLLDRVPVEDPPEDLKQNVLRAIGPRPEPAHPGWFEALRAGVRGRFFAQVYPFAAGVAAGILVFVLASGSGAWRGAGSAPVGGVMAPLGAGGSSPGGASAVKTDDQRFELGRANVRFEVLRSGDRAALSVRSDGADPVEITIQLPPSVRVERLMTVPSAPGGVEYGPGWVRIRNSGRDQVVEVGLAMESGAGDAPLRIAVGANGGTVQGALHTSAGPRTGAVEGAGN